jgi:hypothetical protein
MNDHTATIERLRNAAERIEVVPDLDRVTEPSPQLRASPKNTTPRSHRGLLAAACVALIFAGGVGILASQQDPEGTPTAEGESSWESPTPIPDRAPAPDSRAPAVASVPEWLGDLGPAFREGNARSGRWVSTALAVPVDGGYDNPIQVSVFDGEYNGRSDAEPIEIDGQTFETVQVGAWQQLMTTTTPTLVVNGAVPLDRLTEVMSAARITTNGEDISVVLDSIPDGYQVIVAPQVLGDDTRLRRTLASQTAELAINEVSDWVDPLLYASGTGTDIERLAVNGAPAWAGRSNERFPLTFLVWSPEPGILLEITTTDDNRPSSDLVALAERTESVPIDAWNERYPE